VSKGPIKSKAELKAEAKAKITRITSPELKKTLSSGSMMLLLDIRTEAEYLAGHLPGAVWMPRGKLEFDILKRTQDPNVKIILYCRTGSRSSLACVSLQDMGYKNVRDLDGGFAGWTDEGYTVYNRHGEIKVVDFERKEPKGIEPPLLQK
jgi:rhodanese-related sulfurtransferase